MKEMWKGMENRRRRLLLNILLIFSLFISLSFQEDSSSSPSGSTETSELQAFLRLSDLSLSNKLEFLPVSELNGIENQEGFAGSLFPRAKQDIKKGEVAYSISLKSNAFHLEHVYQLEGIGEALKELVEATTAGAKKVASSGEQVTAAEVKVFPDRAVKLGLLYLRFVSPSHSHWGPWIRSLPSSFDTPLYWNEEELNDLMGSPLYRTSVTAKQTLLEEYKALFPKLTQLYPTLFPSSVFTPENMKWATTVYSSRAYWKSEGFSNPLLPLLETFNFKADSQVKFEETEEGLLNFVALKDIPQGQTVVINDGMMPNRDLLEFFGIVLSHNPHDVWELGVGFSKDDKMYGNKLEMLKKRNLKNHQTYQVKYGDTMTDLIFALRLYHTSLYDFDSMGNALQDKVISLHNERQVAETLIKMCRSSLKEYKTSGKEDKELLQTNVPSRKRKAIIVRRSEKRILTKILNRSKGVLKKVSEQWHLRSMDIPGTQEMKVEQTGYPGEEIL